MKKVSISDVARHAGVSLATASYALSKTGRIAVKTRAKVLNSAQILGFIRDESAVRLRTGKSTILGVIINDINNPFFNEFVGSFEETAWSAGFMTILCTSQDDVERQNRFLSGLVSQGVAGVAISPVHGARSDDLSLLKQRGLPKVVCIRGLEDDSCFVGADDLSAGRLAANYMLEQGHRHLCFVGGYPHTTTWRRRKQGIELAIAAFGNSSVRFESLQGGEGTDFGRDRVSKILQTCEAEPPAIIGFNDMTAIGAYLAANIMNKAVGRDISIIGIDNIPSAVQVLPGLTTVEIFPRKLGEEAAKKLIAQIKGEENVEQMTFITPELILRGSVAQAQTHKS